MGKYPERSHWKAYFRQHREQISQENFHKLERKLAAVEASLHIAQGGERKLLLALRSARALLQKVQEILSL